MKVRALVPGLEQYHYTGFARENIPDDAFRDDVEFDLMAWTIPIGIM